MSTGIPLSQQHLISAHLLRCGQIPVTHEEAEGMSAAVRGVRDPTVVSCVLWRMLS